MPKIDERDPGLSPERGAKGGRPRRDEVEQRREHLLSVATELFMEGGFDGTSIDAVAEAAGVSKPTIYAQFGGKRGLFVEIVRRRVELRLAPLAAAAEAAARGGDGTNLEGILHELSRYILQMTRAPESASLHRSLTAQSLEFPELARLAHEEGWLRAVRALARLFEGSMARGDIEAGDPTMAADLFLTLVSGQTSRLVAQGIEVAATEQERRRKAAVELFLRGMGATREGPRGGSG